MGALMRTPSISRPGDPPDRCRRCGSACPRWWCDAAKTTCRDWHHNWVHRNRLAVSSPIYDETHFCVLAKNGVRASLRKCSRNLWCWFGPLGPWRMSQRLIDGDEERDHQAHLHRQPVRPESGGSGAVSDPACARVSGSRRTLRRLAAVVTVRTTAMTIRLKFVLISGTRSLMPCPQTGLPQLMGTRFAEKWV